MFCANCGKPVPEGARFCENCGTPVEGAASAPPNPPPALVSTPPEEKPSVPAPILTTPPPETTSPPPPPIIVSAPPVEKPIVPTPILTASAPEASISPPPAPNRSLKAPILILVVFLLVMGALGYFMLQYKKSEKKGSGVDVAVSPAQLTLKPGESHLLEATVLGAENTDVGWTVQEGAAGGTVTSAGATAHDGHVFTAGRYTAPAAPGVYHVIATSKADEARASSAVITVAP